MSPERETVKIVIPSHLRHDRVRAKHAVAGAILCVSETQAPKYRQHNPDCEIVTHPDSLFGAAAKRAWIMKHFGSVFMIDDDVQAVVRLYGDFAGKHRLSSTMPPRTASDAIQATAAAAREMGCFLFGLSHNGNPKYYPPGNPFKITGFVWGATLGILSGSKLWIDPGLVVGEDMWLSALNAFFHRTVFIDQRYGIRLDGFSGTTGGCFDVRTVETEKQATLRLKRAFGSAIQVTPPDRSKRCAWERSLVLPF
ncbi:MAG TPA: hypothetical protein PKY77_05680 [Phycisphaerae bacterium]|nr:hypothetical protein [Phycisphaerae bacterium]HRY69066.1 hypothetical protein [Phycisphaerae bacterium]HSA25959.1 hypothetical protein [Phycisphaerae bacterium]